jgi:hypothetical protein
MSIKSSAIYICISFFVFVALLGQSKAEESFCPKNSRIEFHELKNKTLQLCVVPKSKLRQGPFKVLRNLKIEMRGYYLDDMLHGYLEKYKNDQLVEKIPYQLGRIEGKMLRYSRIGKLISESHWKDNKPHGLFKQKGTEKKFYKGIQYDWETTNSKYTYYYGGIKSLQLGVSHYTGSNGESYGPSIGIEYKMHSFPTLFQIALWSKIAFLKDFAEDIKASPSLGIMLSKDINNFRFAGLLGATSLDKLGIKSSLGMSIHPLHALNLPGKKIPISYPRITIEKKDRITSFAIDMEIYCIL